MTDREQIRVWSATAPGDSSSSPNLSSEISTVAFSQSHTHTRFISLLLARICIVQCESESGGFGICRWLQLLEGFPLQGERC